MSIEKPSVYLEPSFISMLAAKPSPLPKTRGMQAVSEEWWETKRKNYDLFISDAVYVEIATGDSEAVERRMELVEGIPVLELTDEIRSLGKFLLALHTLPEKALDDAYHIACAAVHGIDFLLTWNCKHIANERMKPLIVEALRLKGYLCPILLTPYSALGVDTDA